MIRPHSKNTAASVGASHCGSGLARNNASVRRAHPTMPIAGKPGAHKPICTRVMCSAHWPWPSASSGCAGLPDQRLANEALSLWRHGAGAAELPATGSAGLQRSPGLADLQVQTRDPAQIRGAKATYRAAAQTSPRAQARLGRLLVAKPGSAKPSSTKPRGLLKGLCQRRGQYPDPTGDAVPAPCTSLVAYC